MKQLTTLKLLGFVTLSITAFPTFTMETNGSNDNNNPNGREFMNYNKLLTLSDKNSDKDKKRSHKISCYKLCEELLFYATERIKSTSYLCVYGINRQHLNGTFAQLTKNASNDIFSIINIKEYPVTNKHLIRQGDKKTFDELLEIGYHAKQAWRVIKKGFGMRNLAQINNFTMHKEFSLTDEEFNNPDNWDS